MNDERFDLNLLTVFDAVMTELNVTRAAQHLHMTQPAVSNALKRLRHLVNDELFTKVPNGVSPTPKAIEIWLPIRDALTQIRQTLEPDEFEPTTATVTFTIAMNDFSAALVLPRLIGVLEKLAPQVDVRTMPTTNVNAAMLLEQAEIDLALGVFPNPVARLRSQTLFRSSFVCMMRRGHPLAAEPLTLARYVEAKHLLVTLTGESTGFIDLMLQECGLKRRIALTVNQFAVAPQIVAASDLITVLPTRLLATGELVEQLHFVLPPIEIAPTTLKMMWHERQHRNLAQVWLRSQLIELCQTL
jgi:DNA-binding transcriptional LysR family regulator